jgi:HSP20 family protein
MKNALRKYRDPFYSFFDDLTDIGNDVSKMFENFNPWEYPYFKISKQGQANLQSTDNEYKIEVSAPGFKRDELKVELVDNVLTVKGEHSSKIEEDKEDYTRREFSKSSFSRSFKIPENASNEINAKFENGILTISLKKKELPPKEEPKRIDIK